MKCSLCDRDLYARHLCYLHYKRQWRQARKPPSEPKQPITKPLQKRARVRIKPEFCSVCPRPYLASGFCNAHYRRHLLGKDTSTPIRPRVTRVMKPATCSLCENRYWSSGYCVTHYFRIKKNERAHRCSVVDCTSDSPHHAKGLCRRCYNKQKYAPKSQRDSAHETNVSEL